MSRTTPAKSVKKRKRDYIVRFHLPGLHNLAILRVTATSRKEAVDATKGLLEITGEVAPLTINQKLTNMFSDEEIVDEVASDAVAPEVTEEAVAEAPVESAE